MTQIPKLRRLDTREGLARQKVSRSLNRTSAPRYLTNVAWHTSYVNCTCYVKRITVRYFKTNADLTMIRPVLKIILSLF